MDLDEAPARTSTHLEGFVHMRFTLLIPLLCSAVLLTACNKKNCASGPVPSNCMFDLNTCTCNWSDGGLPNTPDASADAGLDAGTPDTETINGDSGSAGGLGTLCDDLAPSAGPSQGIVNASALECRSEICVKPPVQAGVVGAVSTTAYCTEECVQDSDCVGQTRDPSNSLDTRCQTGFTCGIQFVVGPICCRKLCACKDFIAPSGLQTPAACMGDAGANCCCS